MHPNHPMVVHFPIALLLAGLFFDLVALRWRRERMSRHEFVLVATRGLDRFSGPASRSSRGRCGGAGRDYPPAGDRDA
ncbi:MAG: hypothetical protein LZF60_170114 [Nitrospira sp.]|nr:MAG: hypothetical protein LZF60_170114 [Nitrospira sp.]